MKNRINEIIRQNTNLLGQINETKNYFESIMKYEVVMDENENKINVEEIVKILSDIIKENNSTENIGKGINKRNYEKYCKCNESLDLLMKKYIDKGPIPLDVSYYNDVYIDINIWVLQAIHKEVQRRIKVLSNNKNLKI